MADNGEDTWSWSLPTTDDGSGSVTVQVDDGERTPVTDTFNWSATNVPPSITSASFGSGNASCGADNVTLAVAFTDPGTADTHKAEVDWNNDGTYDETDAASLAARILEEWEDSLSAVEVVTGVGGIFDVHVDGDLVFAKSMLGRYPDPDDVVPLVREKLAA